MLHASHDASRIKTHIRVKQTSLFLPPDSEDQRLTHKNNGEKKKTEISFFETHSSSLIRKAITLEI